MFFFLNRDLAVFTFFFEGKFGEINYLELYQSKNLVMYNKFRYRLIIAILFVSLLKTKKA